MFVCFAGGLTTPHSEFPRTELAQTTYWDIDSTTVYSMALTGATQRLTPVRPQVVIAQVFGVNGYLLQIRLNGTSSGVKVEAFANLAQMTAPPSSTQQKIVLDSNYTLGTPYSFRLTAGNGVINVYYGVGATIPAATYTMTSPSDATHFKAGNYLQSNNATFNESGVATSQVSIYSLTLSP